MNVELILIGVIAAGAAGLGGFVYGTHVGSDHALAAQAKIEDVAEKAAKASANISADAISKIVVTNKTVYQKATREVINNPVYRDCLNTDDMQHAINFALTGRGPDKSKLPAAGSPGGQQLRGDGAQADRSGGAVPNLSPGSRPD